MNKKICTILTAAIILFAACKQSAKQDSAVKNDSINRTATSQMGKDHDSLHHVHANTGAKKLTCCIGPPSRLKIKSDKK